MNENIIFICIYRNLFNTIHFINLEMLSWINKREFWKKQTVQTWNRLILAPTLNYIIAYI